jgi:hypothetical protein
MPVFAEAFIVSATDRDLMRSRERCYQSVIIFRAVGRRSVYKSLKINDMEARGVEPVLSSNICPTMSADVLLVRLCEVVEGPGLPRMSLDVITNVIRRG